MLNLMQKNHLNQVNTYRGKAGKDSKFSPPLADCKTLVRDWEEKLFQKSDLQKKQNRDTSEFIKNLESYRSTAEFLPTYFNGLLEMIDNFLNTTEMENNSDHSRQNQITLRKHLLGIKKELEDVKKDYESVQRYFLTVTPTIVKLYSGN